MEWADWAELEPAHGGWTVRDRQRGGVSRPYARGAEKEIQQRLDEELMRRRVAREAWRSWPLARIVQACRAEAVTSNRGRSEVRLHISEGENAHCGASEKLLCVWEDAFPTRVEAFGRHTLGDSQVLMDDLRRIGVAHAEADASFVSILDQWWRRVMCQKYLRVSSRRLGRQDASAAP